MAANSAIKLASAPTALAIESAIDTLTTRASFSNSFAWEKEAATLAVKFCVTPVLSKILSPNALYWLLLRLTGAVSESDTVIFKRVFLAVSASLIRPEVPDMSAAAAVMDSLLEIASLAMVPAVAAVE